MTAISLAEGKKANPRTEQVCGTIRTAVRLIPVAMRAAQRLWPQQTAQTLSSFTEASKRAAEYWIAEEREISAEFMMRLLLKSGEEGIEILAAMIEALPERERTRCWHHLRRCCRRAELSERRRKDRDELEALGPRRRAF